MPVRKCLKGSIWPVRLIRFSFMVQLSHTNYTNFSFSAWDRSGTFKHQLGTNLVRHARLWRLAKEWWTYCSFKIPCGQLTQNFPILVSQERKFCREKRPICMYKPMFLQPQACFGMFQQIWSRWSAFLECHSMYQPAREGMYAWSLCNKADLYLVAQEGGEDIVAYPRWAKCVQEQSLLGQIILELHVQYTNMCHCCTHRMPYNVQVCARMLLQ